MENELLEEKIKMLNKELTFLRDLFLAHAGEVKAPLNFPMRFTISPNKYHYVYYDFALHMYISLELF